MATTKGSYTQAEKKASRALIANLPLKPKTLNNLRALQDTPYEIVVEKPPLLVKEVARFSGEETGRKVPPKCGCIIHQGRASYNCVEPALVRVRGKYGKHGGTLVCANHLRGEITRRQKHRAQVEASQAKAAASDTAEAKAKRLGKRLGMDVSTYYAGYGRRAHTSTTRVVVLIEDLEKLARQLEGK